MEIPKHAPAAIAAIALLLTGCAAAPKPVPQNPQLELEKISSGGYVSKHRYKITTTQEVWQFDHTPLDISLTTPISSSNETFPLIVYLPGLGESVADGILWREAWAEAGYVVLAVQPDYLGPVIWASPLARAADFEEIAKEQSAPSTVAPRLGYVRFVIGEIQRYARENRRPYSQINTDQISLAGFDLGSQTVSKGAGEDAAGTAIDVAIQNIRSIILLSSFIDTPTDGGHHNFASMTLPVLSVTGLKDADPFDLIDSPSLRQTPWQSMPAGDKYLLVLTYGTHAMLAGTRLFDPNAVNDQNPVSGNGAQSSPGEGSGQTGGHRRRRSGGAFSGQNSSSQNAKPGHPGYQQPFNLQQIAAIRCISTAFLDATVKSSDSARQWLAQDAARWLGNSAVLSLK